MSNTDGSFSGVPMVLLNSSSFKNFKSILLENRTSSCNIFNLDKHQQMSPNKANMGGVMYRRLENVYKIK